MAHENFCTETKERIHQKASPVILGLAERKRLESGNPAI
jgi:hypothetical protein